MVKFSGALNKIAQSLKDKLTQGKWSPKGDKIHFNPRLLKENNTKSLNTLLPVKKAQEDSFLGLLNQVENQEGYTLNSEEFGDLLKHVTLEDRATLNNHTLFSRIDEFLLKKKAKYVQKLRKNSEGVGFAKESQEEYPKRLEPQMQVFKKRPSYIEEPSKGEKYSNLVHESMMKVLDNIDTIQGDLENSSRSGQIAVQEVDEQLAMLQDKRRKILNPFDEKQSQITQKLQELQQDIKAMGIIDLPRDSFNVYKGVIIVHFDKYEQLTPKQIKKEQLLAQMVALGGDKIAELRDQSEKILVGFSKTVVDTIALYPEPKKMQQKSMRRIADKADDIIEIIDVYSDKMNDFVNEVKVFNNELADLDNELAMGIEEAPVEEQEEYMELPEEALPAMAATNDKMDKFAGVMDDLKDWFLSSIETVKGQVNQALPVVQQFLQKVKETVTGLGWDQAKVNESVLRWGEWASSEAGVPGVAIGRMIKRTIEKKADFIKQSKIVELDNGKWQVQSEKGKNMGTYDTEKEAQKRLKQIEDFKHKKSNRVNPMESPKTHKPYGVVLSNMDKTAGLQEWYTTFQETLHKLIGADNIEQAKEWVSRNWEQVKAKGQEWVDVITNHIQMLQPIEIAQELGAILASVKKSDLKRKAKDGYPNDTDRCRYCLWFNTDVTVDGQTGFFGRCSTCINAFTKEEMDKMTKEDKDELADFFEHRGSDLVNQTTYMQTKAMKKKGYWSKNISGSVYIEHEGEEHEIEYDGIISSDERSGRIRSWSADNSLDQNTVDEYEHVIMNEIYKDNVEASKRVNIKKNAQNVNDIKEQYPEIDEPKVDKSIGNARFYDMRYMTSEDVKNMIYDVEHNQDEFAFKVDPSNFDHTNPQHVLRYLDEIVGDYDGVITNEGEFYPSINTADVKKEKDLTKHAKYIEKFPTIDQTMDFINSNFDLSEDELREKNEELEAKKMTHVGDFTLIYDPHDISDITAEKKLKRKANIKLAQDDGTKKFNIQEGIGRSKYVVNFHDGVKTHPDGSPFYDIEIFRNQTSLNEFVQELTNDGYVEAKQEIYSKNEKGLKRKAMDEDDIEQGTKIEKEHEPTYKEIKKDVEEDGKLDTTLDDMAKDITEDHLDEHTDYYDDKKGLPAMEKRLEEKKKEVMLSSKDKNISKKAYAETLGEAIYDAAVSLLDFTIDSQRDDPESPFYEKEYPTIAFESYAEPVENEIENVIGSIDQKMQGKGSVEEMVEIADETVWLLMMGQVLGHGIDVFQNTELKKYLDEREITNEMLGMFAKSSLDSILLDQAYEMFDSVKEASLKKKADGGTTHPYYTVKCPKCGTEKDVTPADFVQKGNKAICDKCNVSMQTLDHKPKSTKQLVFKDMKFKENELQPNKDIDPIYEPNKKTTKKDKK